MKCLSQTFLKSLSPFAGASVSPLSASFLIWREEIVVPSKAFVVSTMPQTGMLYFIQSYQDLGSTSHSWMSRNRSPNLSRILANSMFLHLHVPLDWRLFPFSWRRRSSMLRLRVLFLLTDSESMALPSVLSPLVVSVMVSYYPHMHTTAVPTSHPPLSSLSNDKPHL